MVIFCRGSISKSSGSARASRRRSRARARVRRVPMTGTARPISLNRKPAAPIWSSWPWVSTKALRHSAFSRSQEKSGITRSTPGMVAGSGNMSPASMTRRRSSYSKARQFKPISPRPPRGTMRTTGGISPRPSSKPPRMRSGALRSGRPFSCVSCLFFVFPIICAYELYRRHSTWRSRPCGRR